MRHAFFGRTPFTASLSVYVIWALLAVTMNLAVWVGEAHAAQLRQISDTLQDSDPGVKSNHTVKFSTRSAISASTTIVIDFADAFAVTSSPAFAITDATDYDIATSTTGSATDLTLFASGACPGSGLSAFEITSTTATNQSGGSMFTFTHCNGTDAVSASTTITVEIGTHATVGGTGNSQIVNPTATGSYIIAITAPSGDSASTRVAIVDDVTVTASVATNFTFTVSGIASGQTNANDAGVTSITTTATSVPWGTLTANTTSTARQDLAVSTNARHGFSVTIWQDQNLTSSNDADIDIFQNGFDLSTPLAWTSPSSTLDNENTYGHEGITTEDLSLSGGDTFGFALYDAIPTSSSTPLEVFFNTGPANGTTAHRGATRIGFQIEITSLQEAAEDYTQSLTYIATPIF